MCMSLPNTSCSIARHRIAPPRIGSAISDDTSGHPSSKDYTGNLNCTSSDMSAAPKVACASHECVCQSLGTLRCAES